jgi:arylsulfatase A-like enzyme
VVPPNIIFIMSDDHSTQAISAYGDIYDSLAPTPNIDRLAREGVLFSNVFCTNSICGPSRAAILTGKYSHRNGFYKNESGGVFNPDQWTFPQSFRERGYQTGLFGKWHLGSEPTGFDEFSFHVGAGQQGTYWDPEFNKNGVIVRENGYATHLTTDFALDWLDAIRENGKPFLMVLQYKAPHRPWDPDSAYQHLWDEIEMPYPETFNDTYTGRESTAGDTHMTMDFFNRRDMKLTPPEGLNGNELTRWYDYGNRPGQAVVPAGLSAEEARRWRYQVFIKDYLACVRSVDESVGRVLKYLDQSGLADNTVVIYTSDQGFYLGDHGFFDKRFMYEESLRMPFLLRYPARVKQAVNDDIITNIDIAPTLLEFASIEIPEDVQGRSFMDRLSGDQGSWRQSMYYHYYEYPWWHHVKPHYGIRNKQFKLIHFYYDTDVWELYDLEKDPQEMHNVVNDPQYREVVLTLKDELKNLRVQYGNDLPVEELKKITEKDFGSVGY